MAEHDEEDDVLAMDFEHEPITAPRSDHNGELIFVRYWKELMASGPGEWSDSLANHALCTILHRRDDEVNQRVASVAATFVKWLGTACGRAFLSDCKQLTAMHPGSDHGYLMAWSVENERKSWRNAGFRAIELILAEPARRTHGLVDAAPNLSLDDYEVVESIVGWLSTTAGIAFVAKCTVEAEQLRFADNAAAAVAFRDHGPLKLVLKDAA